MEPERFGWGLGARSPTCLSLVSPVAPARALSLSEAGSPSPLPSITAAPLWKHKSARSPGHGSQTLPEVAPQAITPAGLVH